jgi:hypothetical protein
MNSASVHPLAFLPPTENLGFRRLALFTFSFAFLAIVVHSILLFQYVTERLIVYCTLGYLTAAYIYHLSLWAEDCSTIFSYRHVLRCMYADNTMYCRGNRNDDFSRTFMISFMASLSPSLMYVSSHVCMCEYLLEINCSITTYAFLLHGCIRHSICICFIIN